MLKKNYKKSLVLFICLMLLSSGLILTYNGSKNLGLIDYTYQAISNYILPV